MSKNSYIITDKKTVFPGSNGFTSKKSANQDESVNKYLAKLNAPIGNNDYISPETFNLKTPLNKDDADLKNLTPNVRASSINQSAYSTIM